MPQPTAEQRHAFWLGTYAADGDGNGHGVYGTALDGDAFTEPKLAAAADSPSFLAANPSGAALYAVCEFAATIQAYAVTDTGGLAALGSSWSAGDTVCHVAVDPTGRHAVAACYGSGAVVAYRLDPNGAIVARHEATPAHDPHPADEPGDPRGEKHRVSRAHATLMLPDGRAITSDLGFDLARVWRLDPRDGLTLDHEVALPKGTGPRHLALHPSGHVYIVTEFSVEVHVLAEDASGRFSYAGTVPALAGETPEGASGSHITLSERGDRVHVTVRGANRVATLAVGDDGATLTPVDDVDCGGDWPRHHVERGDRIYVMNQRSNTVSTLRVDENGRAGEVLAVSPTPTPTCLVPAG